MYVLIPVATVRVLWYLVVKFYSRLLPQNGMFDSSSLTYVHFNSWQIQLTRRRQRNSTRTHSQTHSQLKTSKLEKNERKRPENAETSVLWS